MENQEKKIWKISRIWICQCGWEHIVQGPCSCWVCMESISFAKWQTGKEAMPMPTKVVVNRRPWTVDQRDRTRDQVERVTIDGVHQMARRTESKRDLGWPEEVGRGAYGRDFLYDNGCK